MTMASASKPWAPLAYEIPWPEESALGNFALIEGYREKGKEAQKHFR